jgi:hypothetical protein
MRQRCSDAGCDDYRDYGARGIRVCDRWQQDFTAFLADMGERPSPKHELDRIDNSRGYEPGNVRWATRTQQARNTRATVLTESDVETIRQLRSIGRSIKDIVATLNLPEPAVRHVAHGETWLKEDLTEQAG